jgi:2-polyprenyl-3-methyl-5-hydroxy-6-metoxy-1,4-benzoquinol methylase
MSTYKCPICNNSSLHRIIPRKVGGQVAECATCGHLTLWPQLENEAVLALYNESAYVVRKKIGTAFFDNHAFDLLKSCDPRKNLNVLDVGCGLGEFLNRCVQEKHHAVGIEVTKSIVDQLVSEGLEVYCKSLSSFRDMQLRYDWVACIDVIEHLPDPLAAIEALAGFVKPKGMLLIHTPNGNAIAKYAEQAHGIHVDPEHLNYFRPEQLVRLFERHGLSLVCTRYYPSSRLTGRAKAKNNNANSINSTLIVGEKKYRKITKPSGIRMISENLPPIFRGMLRSVAQTIRYIGAIDEIISENAYCFSIVLRRS